MSRSQEYFYLAINCFVCVLFLRFYAIDFLCLCELSYLLNCVVTQYIMVILEVLVI